MIRITALVISLCLLHCKPTPTVAGSEEPALPDGEYTGPALYEEAIQIDEHGFAPSDYKRPVLVWLEPAFAGPIHLTSDKPLPFRFRIESRSAKKQEFSVDQTCGFWLYQKDGKDDLHPPLPLRFSEDPEWVVVSPGDTVTREYDLRYRFEYVRAYYEKSAVNGFYDMRMQFALKGQGCRTPSNRLQIKIVM